MNNIIEINLHGELGKTAGRKQWNLNVGSVAEALHAINAQTQDSIRKHLFKRENAYGKYKVLINEKKVEPITDLKFNELTVQREDIKKVDIIPVLEGSFDFSMVGIILGGVGMLFATTPMGMMTSLMLLTMGISNMLAKPPEMPEQRQIVNPSSDPTALANSYLFSGPVNVINEGGPVPLGYGRLIVGSQVIMSAYDVRYVWIEDAGRVR
jgi:predicted phage tail protein